MTKGKSKKKIVLFLLAIVLAIGGSGSYLYLQNKQAETETVARERQYTAQMGEITVGIDAEGKISLLQKSLPLSKGVVIKDFTVSVGDVVKKGDKVANIDQEVIQSILNELQDKKNSAVANLENVEDDNNSDTSRDTVTLAQNKLDAVKKEVADVKNLLEAPTLYANTDGIVLDIIAQKGVAIAMDPVKIIGDAGNPEIIVPIEGTNINDVEVMQKVKFTTGAYPSQTFTGVVKHKKLVPNSEGKYDVTLTVDQTDAKFQQGMSVAVTLIVQQKKDILTLSNKAITLTDGKQFVKMRDENGALKDVEITTGFSDGRVSEVVSGLKDGDLIIVEDAV
nr:efflux RND transporter periplasmic adaptor subunit [uncultured Acetobacterium sp.]